MTGEKKPWAGKLLLLLSLLLDFVYWQWWPNSLPEVCANARVVILGKSFFFFRSNFSEKLGWNWVLKHLGDYPDDPQKPDEGRNVGGYHRNHTYCTQHSCCFGWNIGPCLWIWTNPVKRGCRFLLLMEFSGFTKWLGLFPAYFSAKNWEISMDKPCLLPVSTTLHGETRRDIMRRAALDPLDRKTGTLW